MSVLCTQLLFINCTVQWTAMHWSASICGSMLDVCGTSLLGGIWGLGQEESCWRGELGWRGREEGWRHRLGGIGNKIRGGRMLVGLCG